MAKVWDWDLVPYRKERKTETWLNKFDSLPCLVPVVFMPISQISFSLWAFAPNM